MKKLEDLYNQPFKVEIPHGKLSTEGQLAIAEIMKNSGLPFPTEEEMEWQWQTKRGNFPKRLQRWLAIKGFKNLDPSIMASVGATGNRYIGDISKSDPYYFKFVPPPFNWRDGQYGKERSCWWTQNQKEYWQEMNGSGVCFYKSGEDMSHNNGIGRLWIGNGPKDTLMTFNGYYNNSEKENWTLNLTQVVATFLGLTYRKIRLSCQGMHVNSDMGYLLGTGSLLSEAVESLKLENNIRSLTLVVPQVRRVFCSSCNVRLLNEQDERLGQGRIYCIPCYERIFFDCEMCKLEKRIQSRIKCGDKTMCLECFNTVAMFCDGCMQTFWKHDISNVNGINYCITCYFNNTLICPDCKEHKIIEEFTDVQVVPCDCCQRVIHEPAKVCQSCRKVRLLPSQEVHLL